MRIFKDGIINGVPYWGYFETRKLSNTILKDLTGALNSQVVITKKESTNQKYVLAFKLNNHLYVNRHGYHAFLVTKKGVWHAPRGLKTVPFPGDGVLVLSKEYIDDIPKYTTATEFCRTMNSFYFHQYCIHG